MQNLQSVIPKKIVLIGASTGGPGQIQKIITSLPILKQTSVLIAQHMVEGFLESFASRLQNTTKNNLKIIKNNQTLETSTIYIAEGVTHLNTRRVFQQQKASSNSYNPDINSLFNSFAPLSQEVEILSVILTGIGSDGIDACVNLSNHGVRCITESESSAIVDGMPNRARALVPSIQVYEIDKIIKIISEFCDV